MLTIIIAVSAGYCAGLLAKATLCSGKGTGWAGSLLFAGIAWVCAALIIPLVARFQFDVVFPELRPEVYVLFAIGVHLGIKRKNTKP